MNALIVKEVTQLKNAQLGRLLVSCVKGLPTILLSVTFTPWYNEPSSRKKEVMKEALMEILEEAMRKEEMEDTPKEDPSKPCTKSCYSCGEEGHISQNCLNGDLVEFPTEEV